MSATAFFAAGFRAVARLGVHALDGFAFAEEDAVHPDVGLEGDGFVVHEVTVEDVRRGVEQPVVGGLQVEREQVFEGGGRVEGAELAGNGLFSSDVEKPDHLAVGGVKEGDPVAVPVAGAVKGAAGIAFGLLEDVLRVHGEFLGFQDPEEPAVASRGAGGRPAAAPAQPVSAPQVS